MPLFRYFLFAGSALLALLFISDAYLPREAVVASSNPEAPLIRINSDRKTPERVVYDTTHPPIQMQRVAQANVRAIANKNVADASPREISPKEVSSKEASAKARILDAFAQLQPSDMKLYGANAKLPEAKVSQANLTQVSQVQTSPDVKAPDTTLPPKPIHKRKIAKTRVGPPTVLVAQQQQYGFFASNGW